MNVKAINLLKRREVNQFIRFPFDLYSDSQIWVPPLISDMHFILNPKRHPFYAHSEAVFIIAEDKGRVLGRLAVLNPRKHNVHHNERSAFFSLFECVNDGSATSSLFEYAVTWARERGLERLVGPLGFIPGDAKGLLIEGFQHRPAMGVPYNYDYYDRLILENGFRKLTDYYSGYLPGNYELPDRFLHIARKVKETRNFHIKSFRDKAELRSWVYRIQRVYNAAFENTFLYAPLTQAETKVIADRFLSISIPRMIKLVMKGDEVIGFLFAFIDISAAIQKSHGKLFPFGWLHFKQDFKKSRCININGVGLLPGHRGVGANAVLYSEMAETLRNISFDHADIVQIEEGNVKSQGDMRAIGVEWRKKHRVYHRDVA